MAIKIDPILAVHDVDTASKWYQKFFGCCSQHGGPTFEVLADRDGQVLFCLHKWGEHDHPSMRDATMPVGNGLILYLKTKMLEEIRDKVLQSGLELTTDLHQNTNSNQPEFSFWDPFGYFWIITRYHEYEG